MIRLSADQAAKLGIVPSTALRPGSHAGVVAAYPDALIEAAIDDLGKRNLRNQQDHETRWCAERASALRAERRKRKDAGTWSIQPRKKTAA